VLFEQLRISMKSRTIPHRRPEVVVISDTHLGTYGCHAKELLMYLKSIEPKILILNGDIIDIWQFRKHYFPKSHIQVIRHLTGKIARGHKVIYITGNHDELLRKFVKFKLGSFELVNKYLLNLNGKKAWLFHGDVFDVTMQHSKWVARLGSKGYDLLILVNSFINYILSLLGKDKFSFSKKIKDRVKQAVAFINRFEETAAAIAIRNGYDYVICGHVHQPEIREISNNHGNVMYLNTGDWVENLSALEYQNGVWTVYRFSEDNFARSYRDAEKRIKSWTDKELFDKLLEEFQISQNQP
jgi:UDP-2,3-diacylglucosamine pyrophosphatase LpxH